MEKFKKMIVETLKKGFATEEEQNFISQSAEKLSDKEYKEVEESVDEVEKLPLEKPVVGGEEVKKDEGEEENQSTETRAERRAKARMEKGK